MSLAPLTCFVYIFRNNTRVSEVTRNRIFICIGHRVSPLSLSKFQGILKIQLAALELGPHYKGEQNEEEDGLAVLLFS